MWGSLQTLPHHSEAATSSHSLLDPSGPWVFTVAHLMLPGGMDYSSECGGDLTSPPCDAQNHSPVLVFAQHLFLPTSAAVDKPGLSALRASHPVLSGFLQSQGPFCLSVFVVFPRQGLM